MLSRRSGVLFSVGKERGAVEMQEHLQVSCLISKVQLQGDFLNCDILTTNKVILLLMSPCMLNFILIFTTTINYSQWPFFAF